MTHPGAWQSRLVLAFLRSLTHQPATSSWDFFTGSHTLLEYIEFVYYLKKFGDGDYLTSDSHPTRWDIKRMFEKNSRLTDKLWRLLDRVGMKRLAERINSSDYVDTWHFIQQEIFGWKDV